MESDDDASGPPLDADDATDDDTEAEDEGAASGGDSAPFFGVYLPVVLGDEPLAELALGERVGRGPYDEDMLVFMRHVLRNFAGAVHRSLLIERDEERLRELDALLKVSTASRSPRRSISTPCCARS